MKCQDPHTDEKIRILLIDDDEDDYLITKELIAEIPGDRFVLDWESDFDRALDLICQSKHDVYLVDFRLGDKTGLELLIAMRERACQGPVILLTGISSPEIDRAAEAAGAADYLEKGRLDAVHLERSIRYALRQRAQEIDLERKVAVRTAELEKANQALKEADRRKNEFLATLSHELRNPLAPIRNAIEIMRISKDNYNSIENARELIDRQVRHMVRLIDDLLDASRITRDKLRLEIAPLDLREAIQSAIETSLPRIESSGLHFILSGMDDELMVNGDLVRLSQVFSNLLTNAAKFTESGGTVSLIVEKVDSQACVRVKDTGNGIPPELLPSIFDLFSQADHTLHRSQNGLGIGLALAKRLVEMHGGTVTGSSQGVGFGAEFTVTLPLLNPGNYRISPVLS